MPFYDMPFQDDAGSQLNANELLFVQQAADSGILRLAYTTAPSATANVGKVYVKSSDSNLYYLTGAGTEFQLNTAGGGGTVTSVSVATANGVSGSVANPTTTPAITLTLGAITPTSVAATGALSGSNFSGSSSGVNTGDQTITLTGGVTGSGTGSFAVTVITNANLTGAVTSVGNATSLGSFNLAALNAALSDADVATGGGTATGTNTGDQTSIVGITGTKAQFDTAVTDGNFLYVGDVTQYTDEMAQDAVGAMVDTTLVYVDATPLLTRAALTGAITASQGSNATVLGSFTISALNTAVSDADVAILAANSFTGVQTYGAAQIQTPVVITDAAGAVINAALGNIFTWSAGADRTAGTTTNPVAGQKIVIEFTASGGARTLTLPTATTGDFRFGSDITTLTQTASGKTDYIGCIYNGAASRWDVVAFTKGF